MTKTQTIKMLKKYIGDTIKSHRLNRRGYRCEYQFTKKGEAWDGDFLTLNELVNEMIEFRVGKWSIWMTGINGYSVDTINYQEFNVDEIIAKAEDK